MTLALYKRVVFFLLLLSTQLSVAQSGIAVNLSVNNKQQLSVYRDEPLLISLSFSNPAASAGEQWNREADIGLTNLENLHKSKKIDDEKFKIEQAKIESAKKKVKPTVLGSAETTIDDLVKFSVVSKGDSLAIPMKFLIGSLPPYFLDASAFYELEWGVRREQVLTCRPGKYLITALIEGHSSNTVQLTIESGPIPRAKLQHEKTQLRLGQFALAYGFPDSAIFHARNVLGQRPSSIEGWVLLAEAYTKQEKFVAALQSFETALRIFHRKYPNAHEPLGYILGMIQWLKEKTVAAGK